MEHRNEEEFSKEGPSKEKSGQDPRGGGGGATFTGCGFTSRAKPLIRLWQSPISKKICEDKLKGKYRIEVVDLLVKPQLAKGDQIIAIPTLVRRLPPPVKKIIGNLSKTESVIVGLDLQPVR